MQKQKKRKILENQMKALEYPSKVVNDLLNKEIEKRKALEGRVIKLVDQIENI